MYSNYTEETKPLFRLLRTEAFRFILVRFNHYSLREQLKQELQERYPNRPVKEIDAAKIDYRQLVDEYYKLGHGLFIINNFEKVMDNREFYNGLNLRRDKLAQYSVAMICFISPAADRRYARKLMEIMPDLWSFRSLMLDLEVQISVQENFTREPVSGQYNLRTTTLGGFSREEKERELARLLLLAGQNEPVSRELLVAWYEQIKDLQTDIGLYDDAIATTKKMLQLADEADDYARLLIDNGDIYKTIGRYDEALKCYEEAKTRVEASRGHYYEQRLAISLERAGGVYEILGDTDKALLYYERNFQLNKVSYESSPGETNFKNGLAVSYEKLGGVHEKMGALTKALKYYQDGKWLCEELARDYPNNVSFKNGLAVSYEKIGGVYEKMVALDEALEYYEKIKALAEELHRGYPRDVSFKNWLAVSYSKLGGVYETMGALTKALKYYEGDIKLSEELQRDYPQDVSFKNGLAISYSNLAVFYINQSALDAALVYFEKAKPLYAQLVQEKNGLQATFVYNYELALYYFWPYWKIIFRQG